MNRSNLKLEKEKEACLKEAGENAHTKAQKLAASVGATLGEVLALIENPQAPREPFRPVLMQSVRRAQVAEEAPAPSIEAGSQEISVVVEAVFALKGA